MESPLFASSTFDYANWKYLEESVDEELSSDTNLVDIFHSFNIPSVSPKKPVIIDDSDQSESFTTGSMVTIPTPSSNLEIESPLQNIDAVIHPNKKQEPAEQLDKKRVELASALRSVDSKHGNISECNSPCSSEVNKIKSAVGTNVGKKRSQCPEKWNDKNRKQLVNSGQQYITKNGRVKNKKQLRPICPKTCKLKCYEKFDLETRQNIFRYFWNLADHTRQWEFINKFTKRFNKKHVTTEGPSRRLFTMKYFLPVCADDTIIPQRVCLKTFLNTLCITDQFVRTARSKMNQKAITLSDNRGKHSKHTKIINSVMIKSVCDHVASFRPIETHYIRKDTNKLYLDNNLSMNKMFSLYKQWDQLPNYDNQAQTLRQYRNIIKSNINVGYLRPKKGICDKCHSFSNNSSPTEEQQQRQFKHVQNNKIARAIKNNDKKHSIESPDIVCATFDFPKILNCPHGDVGAFYYKRKLSLFNFIVFDVALKVGTCYMWTECNGKGGCNEVSSCLMKFINAKVDEGAKKFIFWSDNCAGQKRNRVVYSLYMYLSKRFEIDITHRFLEKGHTQNEGDSVHARIERESKRKLIYTPDQWFALVRRAKKAQEKPYNVIKVAKHDIFDFKLLLDDKNWKKDNRNENVNWKSIKEVCVRKEEPQKLYFKYDFMDDYYWINTIVETESCKNKKCQTMELNNLYPDSLALPIEKYKDLISLCNSGAIPKQYHEFYESLEHSTAPETADYVSESDE